MSQQPYVLAQVPITGGFEGRIPWMYRDNSAHGWVTCACGKMLPNVAAAQALPFMLADGVTPATPQQIADMYAKVLAMPAGLIARAYNVLGALVLTGAEIDALLLSTLSDVDDGLNLCIHSYELFPDAAKQVLIDMDYNLGTTRMLKEFPHFIADCEGMNWLGAAQQCHRVGVSDARNAWTRQQFESAVNA